MLAIYTIAEKGLSTNEQQKKTFFCCSFVIVWASPPTQVSKVQLIKKGLLKDREGRTKKKGVVLTTVRTELEWEGGRHERNAG